MVDDTKCSSAEDGTTTDEDRDVRVDSGGSDEELCMDEEDEDGVSPTSAPGALTFGISRLLAGGGGGGGGRGHDESSVNRHSGTTSAGTAAASVSGPAEALASLYAAGHHAAVYHHLHQQQQQHMAAAAAAHQAAAAAAVAEAAKQPADDNGKQAYLQYTGAAGVIKVPAHRPHPSGGAGGPSPMPSPWATAAIDPVSFMQRNAFLFAADKNRLAAGTFRLPYIPYTYGLVLRVFITGVYS